MNVTLVAKGEQKIVEGLPGTGLIQSPDDVVDLIGACFENKAQAVLLYAENLTERFFDLSSGEAGAILQKFRNYRTRVAVVVSQDGSPQSSKFREMVSEESRGGDFRLFGDREAAEAWLLGD
ncbi:MAG: DUF4180 domain-containing protein [Chloroflexia bacterium]